MILMKYLLLIIGCLTSLISYSQNGWKTGHYYDKKGNVHYGQIKYNYDFSPSIEYRESEDSKEIKIKSWKSKGFVVEQDSFTVIQNFDLLQGYRIAHDFAQVIEVGPIILLKNFSSIASGGTPMSGGHGMTLGSSEKLQTYILTKPNSEKLWIVYSNRKQFESLLKEITKDFPADSRFKEVNSIEYEMVPEVISEYNRLKENNDM